MDYSKKTQNLIDKLCKIAERKSYVLEREKSQELILKTYDLFDIPRPKKIVWFDSITEKFLDSASRAYSAYRASRAYSASSASSAYRASRAYSASSAFRAYSAYSASSAYRASRAYSASSAYRASRAYSASSAYSASVDYDFHWAVLQFEYIQNPEGEKPNENDRKYLKYSELIIKAKELGVGYFCDFEDVLYLVPVPIITCDEQNRYHNEKGPAIYWPNSEEVHYLRGVNFDKKWWSKIVNDDMGPEEVFAIDNLEHRRIAYEYMDKTKMKSLKDYKVLDEVKDDGHGYAMKLVSFTVKQVEKPLKYLNCFCSSTGREYFIGTDSDTCWEAKSASFGLKSEEVEYVNEW